jgi:4-hydroxy-tetrahydrodipicolinate synthase
MGDNMPACAKYALSLQNCPVGYVRKPMNEATPKQRERIEATLKDLLALTPSKIKKAA